MFAILAYSTLVFDAGGKKKRRAHQLGVYDDDGDECPPGGRHIVGMETSEQQCKCGKCSTIFNCGINTCSDIRGRSVVVVTVDTWIRIRKLCQVGSSSIEESIIRTRGRNVPRSLCDFSKPI